MMISEKMAKRLNEQVTHEYFAKWAYLAMALAFEDMNLKGFANWFYAQAAEEEGHARKIGTYMLDQGASVKLMALPEPKTDYKSAEEIVQAALNHELKVTEQVHEIARMAEEEGDLATRNFISWKIEEQVEEVASMTELLAMVKMAQSPGQLLMLQNHIKRED